MKKNLRIVSAAAAALLAVAPVAATVAPAASTTVSADPVSAPTKTVYVKADKTYLYKFAASDNATPVQLGTDPLSLSAGTKLTANGAIKDGIIKNHHYNLLPVSYNNTTYYIRVDQVSDNAPATTTPGKPEASEGINSGSTSIFNQDSNLALNLTAIASNGNVKGAINGNVVLTVDGKQYTALLHGQNGINFTNIVNKKTKQTVNGDLRDFPAGEYSARISGVTVNLGNAYANKQVKLVMPKNVWITDPKTNADVQEVTLTADASGVLNLGDLDISSFWAYDSADLQEVHFYAMKTGNVVTSGSVNLHARNDGKLNVNAIYNALSQEYVASQLVNGQNVETLVPVNDIKAQLEKANIKVDDNGYFTAPASFNINMNAKSNNNGATATLPVTVNVDNAQVSNNAQETTKTVKIMHIATIYDKNGKATHEPALRAYNTVSVVSNPVSLKDEKGNDAGKFYKLAGKDQYIKVGNVDGTSRSLKHNSYVYKSTGKRRGKTVLKKGSSVTTYGKSFMIAGHQMYRIGENQYVKKANF